MILAVCRHATEERKDVEIRKDSCPCHQPAVTAIGKVVPDQPGNGEVRWDVHFNPEGVRLACPAIVGLSVPHIIYGDRATGQGREMGSFRPGPQVGQSKELDRSIPSHCASFEQPCLIIHTVTILAIDTTSEAGGAAIFDNDTCLAQIAHQGAANQYSVVLFEMTERLVAEVRARPNPPLKSQRDIDLYAVANGPGSFTGIRVGIAAALAWAKVFGKPAQGVSILDAVVESVQPRPENAVVILNAYRGEFYVGEFRKDRNGRLVASEAGRVSTPGGLKDFAPGVSRPGADWMWIVRAHDKPAMALRETLPADLCWRIVQGTLLDAIARLARRAALEGHLDLPGELDAYYIRRTDAELNWKE